MATYAIGDIHGCFKQLKDLLKKIDYDENKDILWFTGDYINGGPQSLETLRFLMSLGNKKAKCILGNHDVYFLGVAEGILPKLNDRKIGIDNILNASDLLNIIHWLKALPFAHYEASYNALIVHAGVLPNWSLSEILKYANILSNTLQGPYYHFFLKMILGDEKNIWNENLNSWEKISFIYKCFTRMRFCKKDGNLFNLSAIKELEKIPNGFMPWFKIPRQNKNLKIIFGHWANLLGKTGVKNAIAIDTGCVWGHALTALRLDDWKRFEIYNNS